MVAAGAGGAAYWRFASEKPVLAPAMAAAPPQVGDQRMAERGIGRADAPVVVTEWFSMTCPHCAAFHRDSMPAIKGTLLATGKARLVFRDFPQLALTAAMVARALPAERYEAFLGALLASQDRWAFNRQANPIEELAKIAALAGLGRDAFNAAAADQDLRTAILKGQEEGDKTYHIDSTPSFIFNGPGAKNRREAGGKSPEDFAKLVAAAAG
ncbi:MAG: thioredoxin domain-containing protein [Alphaproteobacteria bacterium]|nr:thioredoxin domain-containing protein [Alphaproteobacteria bacterium]